MDLARSIPAFLTYLLPVLGWIYVGVFQPKNRFAVFHMRQSMVLFLFVLLVTAAWYGIAWLLAWIPYAFVFGILLFTLPLAFYIFCFFAWITGMVNALRCREAPLPWIGAYSRLLPA